MTEKMPLTKLNGQRIYNGVVKGNMTLRQLAECFDCSFEQFFVECKKIIGHVEWPRVERADRKNAKTPSRKDEKSMQQKKYPYISKAQKKQIIQSEMETVQEQLQISQVVLEDFHKRHEKAKKDEMMIKKSYEDAVQRRVWTEEHLERAKNQVERYQKRIDQLQQKLDEFVIWLVAPGYKGEIPRGKLITVVPFDGYNLIVEKGDDLLNDVSFAEMMGLGFETLRDADTALEFAKLVLKYQFECEEEFKILVDDERIISILRAQEVEI